MNLPNFVVITGGALSDIFFNFHHTTYNGACESAEDGLSDEQCREALAVDAHDFCLMIGEPEALEQQLIDDFMARR